MTNCYALDVDDVVLMLTGHQIGSKHVVRAVAKRRFIRVLATADIEGASAFSLEADRFDASVLVFAVAKRLALGKPAGAPSVHTALFEFDLIRSNLGRYGIVSHRILHGMLVW